MCPPPPPPCPPAEAGSGRVQALLDKGEFDYARRALARGREAARAVRIGGTRYEAAFLAQEARVDDLQLAYRTAAAKYAEAATLVAPFDTEQQWGFLLDHLGISLARLGERESGTARLAEAVAAFREALQEYTRERAPLDWARTQTNLGNALGALDELEEAIAAYREALKEFTRARVALQWATTQMNLGNTLARLGERESGTARLEEAVAAHREALQELTRAGVPLQWATTQMNLAAVYTRLFDKDHQPRHFDDALEAVDGALEEFRKRKAAFYIDKAERVRGEILAAKGKL